MFRKVGCGNIVEHLFRWPDSNWATREILSHGKLSLYAHHYTTEENDPVFVNFNNLDLFP